jgi:hypothetical protein
LENYFGNRAQIDKEIILKWIEIIDLGIRDWLELAWDEVHWFVFILTLLNLPVLIES